jgi:hypothetical protein
MSKRIPGGRRLSPAEVAADDRDVANRLEQLRLRWEKNGDLHALLGALFLCQASVMPAWVFEAVRDHIIKTIKQMPGPSRDELRWMTIQALRERETDLDALRQLIAKLPLAGDDLIAAHKAGLPRRKRAKLTLDEAFKLAAALEIPPKSVDTMQRAYKAIERQLKRSRGD